MRGVLTASALKSRTVGGLGGQEARGPGSPPSTPSRMHPKIMLYAKEYIRDDMMHSGHKPGGPGIPLPQAECFLKLRAMQGNNMTTIRARPL